MNTTFLVASKPPFQEIALHKQLYKPIIVDKSEKALTVLAETRPNIVTVIPTTGRSVTGDICPNIVVRGKMNLIIGKQQSICSRVRFPSVMVAEVATYTPSVLGK